jgi:hypothetical protein
VIEEVVCPPGSQEYVYGLVPPPAVALTDPSHPNEQDAFPTTSVAVKTGGCVNVTDVFAVHPFPSVAVNVYPPAHNPVIEEFVPPFDHK